MFDSGLGGLTVLRAVRSLDDAVDVFYFADTAHVPYGDRKLVEVSGFARRIIARLLEHDPSAILIACGTTCSAFDALGWPSIGIPLFGLVAAGAREACAATRSGKVGVVATNATARSGVFDRAIHALMPDASVVDVGAPALVPIVESGQWSSDAARAAVSACCATFVENACDTVVLGCTHFPHLSGWFESALGARVRIVDPAEAAARDAVRALGAMTPQAGRIVFEVSGDPADFASRASLLSSAPVDDVVRSDLWTAQVSQP